MNRLYVKIADCSYEQLVRVAERCGFKIVQGKKHCKVKTISNNFVTTIPRHSRLKRETVRGIVETMNKFGARIEVS